MGNSSNYKCSRDLCIKKYDTGCNYTTDTHTINAHDWIYFRTDKKLF